MSGATSGERRHLFQRGDFTLASGSKSSWKIECDALTEDDWAGLATMLAPLVGPFGEVVGVPRGGLPLADALREHVVGASDRILVADDVWTTGRSMARFMAGQEFVYRAATDVMRAVVFARNPTPPGVTALFTMGATSRGDALAFPPSSEGTT